MERNDNTLDFFDKYLSKYAIEIVNFNEDIKVNDHDNEVFLNAMSTTMVQGFNECSVLELENAIEIYDSVSFYVSCGLLYFDYDKKSYFINPTKLLEKINAKDKWNKDYSDDNNYEVVSVYTRGSK